MYSEDKTHPRSNAAKIIIQELIAETDIAVYNYNK